MTSRITLAALLAVLATPALAAQRTVTLDVSGMTCAVCPITVRKALSKVEGVDKAEVDYQKQQATVIFDDAKTDVAKLTRATADAGYPTSVKGAAR